MENMDIILQLLYCVRHHGDVLIFLPFPNSCTVSVLSSRRSQSLMPTASCILSPVSYNLTMIIWSHSSMGVRVSRF
jgi:hypothetical protein